MAAYLTWSEQTITDFSEQNLNTLYNQGYLFTRKGRGQMYQTRSMRVDLSNFSLTSENRRVLRKTEGLELRALPLPHPNYNWNIHKMGKDFYDKKFGEKTFTANKLKELMTDEKKSNFNLLLEYKFKDEPVGYCICFHTEEFLHYCYPFYQIFPPKAGPPLEDNIQYPISNIGLGMMLCAIIWAKEQKKKYVYLGSAQRASDTYKLQFDGLEWWGGERWEQNVIRLKDELNKLL